MQRHGIWRNCTKCKCLSLPASPFPCTRSSSLTCQLYPQDMLPSCSMWHTRSHVLSLQLISAVKLLHLWPESRWLQRKAFPLAPFCWHHVWSTLTDPGTDVPSFLQPSIRGFLAGPPGFDSMSMCRLYSRARVTVFACHDLDDANV